MRISDWSSDVCSSDLPALRATTRLEDLAATELCLLAVPAQALRGVADALAPVLGPRLPVVLCAKGIEAVSGLLMNEVTAEALPGRPLAEPFGQPQTGTTSGRDRGVQEGRKQGG